MSVLSNFALSELVERINELEAELAKLRKTKENIRRERDCLRKRLGDELAKRDKAIGEAVMGLQKFIAEYELKSALDVVGYLSKITSCLEAARKPTD